MSMLGYSYCCCYMVMMTKIFVGNINDHSYCVVFVGVTCEEYSGKICIFPAASDAS